MSLFYDTQLLNVVESLVNELIDAEIKYKARIDINSNDVKPSATIENYAVRVKIFRSGRKLVYVVTDLGKYYHAQKEGFTEQQIDKLIRCHFIATKKIAKSLLLMPELLATIRKENLQEMQNSS